MLFLLVGVENRQTFLFFRTIWGRATCVTSDSSMSWTFRPPFIVCQEKSLFFFIQCCTKSLNIHVKTKFTNSTVDILISRAFVFEYCGRRAFYRAGCGQCCLPLLEEVSYQSLSQSHSQSPALGLQSPAGVRPCLWSSVYLPGQLPLCSCAVVWSSSDPSQTS